MFYIQNNYGTGWTDGYGFSDKNDAIEMCDKLKKDRKSSRLRVVKRARDNVVYSPHNK